jgi:hypothetical protein
VAERAFAWLARARRLARDYERLPRVAVGLHFAAGFGLTIQHAATLTSGNTLWARARTNQPGPRMDESGSAVRGY